MSATFHARFASGAVVVRARRRIAQLGGRVLAARSPVPPHDTGTSAVRRWVLAGGVVGFAAGWALTIGTSLAWPLRVGGKPIVSLPAFFVIAFELTILFAALSGLAGFLRHARLPGRPGPGYEADLAVDGFGLLVSCDAATEVALREAMRQLGADIRELSP